MSLMATAVALEDDSRPPGTVTRVREDGYTINDRLLRPARVAVSRSAEARSASGESCPGLVPDLNNRHDDRITATCSRIRTGQGTGEGVERRPISGIGSETGGFA